MTTTDHAMSDEADVIWLPEVIAGVRADAVVWGADAFVRTLTPVGDLREAAKEYLASERPATDPLAVDALFFGAMAWRHGDVVQLLSSSLAYHRDDEGKITWDEPAMSAVPDQGAVATAIATGLALRRKTDPDERAAIATCVGLGHEVIDVKGHRIKGASA